MKRQRLILKSETVRQLNELTLRDVKGAVAPESYYCDSWTNPIESQRCNTERSLCSLLSYCTDC